MSEPSHRQGYPIGSVDIYALKVGIVIEKVVYLGELPAPGTAAVKDLKCVAVCRPKAV